MPKRLVHAKRRSIGIRVPDDAVAQGLLEQMGEPLLTTTLRPVGDEEPLREGYEIKARLGSEIEVVLDAGPRGVGLSTIIDLTTGNVDVVRQGVGEIEWHVEPFWDKTSPADLRHNARYRTTQGARLSTNESSRRVLSGMRPTGRLHLGHLHGVLNNWVQLQHEYECFFFVADYHALTTHYDESETIDQYTYDTVVDWLAAGVNPGAATVFVQSRVPEHAELHLHPVNDHASELARARAELQGPAAEARRQGPRRPMAS